MAVPEIEPLIKGLGRARERYVYGFGKVPDDRLEWSPAGEGHNALQLCGRLSLFLYFLGEMMKTGVFPDRSTFPPPPTSREEALDRLNSRFDEVFAMLEGFTEADLARVAPTPWGEQTTVRRWIDNLGSVVSYHQGQLNYFQLCYGDKDANIPPSWMPAQG